MDGGADGAARLSCRRLGLAQGRRSLECWRRSLHKRLYFSVIVEIFTYIIKAIKREEVEAAPVRMNNPLKLSKLAEAAVLSTLMSNSRCLIRVYEDFDFVRKFIHYKLTAR
ncbi:hypothetical protein EJB05_43114 [Eragrostis curvula]|uniref:Uncharacterized protein n=1 Tax=Eragrostis curvula TaxID=38414 RepID=A0A5J9TF37_9POAL|nr:hypothetical protein EJB05_43114 [Eragrostis curvula]